MPFVSREIDESVTHALDDDKRLTPIHVAPWKLYVTCARGHRFRAHEAEMTADGAVKYGRLSPA